MLLEDEDEDEDEDKKEKKEDKLNLADARGRARVRAIGRFVSRNLLFPEPAGGPTRIPSPI